MPRSINAPTLADVAALAGVSIQTVSNVLNEPEKVRPHTREKVIKAVKKANYTPNLSARRLRSKKASTIAVRVDTNSSPDLFGGFIQDDFVYEVIEAAEKRSIKVIAYTAKTEELEIERMKSFMTSRDADGIILTSTRTEDPRLNYLGKQNVPFLSFGRPWGSKNLFSTKHPWVDVDGGSGVSAVTNMLWNSGHRCIAFAGWEGSHGDHEQVESVGQDRFLGWKRSFSALIGKSGREADKAINALATFGTQSVESGRQSARRLLEINPDIDAVVCVSDTVALGCLLEFARISSRKITVTGFDNSPISSEFGFTSIDQSLGEVAKSALAILMGESGNQIRKVDFSAEKTKAHILLPPRLVIR